MRPTIFTVSYRHAVFRDAAGDADDINLLECIVSDEVAGYLTQAAGYPCTFRAAIEGTVQESDKAILSAQGQYNWNTGYGGAELGVSYPITKHVRAYTQIYSGYGESLIDYNFNQTRVGVGLMLNDLF